MVTSALNDTRFRLLVHDTLNHSLSPEVADTFKLAPIKGMLLILLIVVFRPLSLKRSGFSVLHVSTGAPGLS